MTDGSKHMWQLDRGEIKLFSLPAYMPLFLIVCEIYGHKVSKLWKIWNFFERFGPPCRNALADLDGSTPECAQVCALQIGPHLATLRKIEMVAVVCTNETTPNSFSFKFLTSPPSAPRGRWTPQRRRHVGRHCPYTNKIGVDPSTRCWDIAQKPLKCKKFPIWLP